MDIYHIYDIYHLGWHISPWMTYITLDDIYHLGWCNSKLRCCNIFCFWVGKLRRNSCFATRKRSVFALINARYKRHKGIVTTTGRADVPARQKATIHQVTTMLATSKNVIFPGPNHQCWWNFTLIITLTGTRPIIKVLGHQHWWLAGGYNLEIGHFKRWLAWWFTWWIDVFLHRAVKSNIHEDSWQYGDVFNTYPQTWHAQVVHFTHLWQIHKMKHHMQDEHRKGQNANSKKASALWPRIASAWVRVLQFEPGCTISLTTIPSKMDKKKNKHKKSH